MIDSGLVKQRSYRNGTGVDALVVTSISKQSATQRSGRAGREAEGKCFRIFTEKTFNELRDVTVPEILRCNLAGVILSLKAIGITNISNVDFIDKPEQRALLAAFQTLIKLEAICPESANLTQVGHQMAILPTEPIYSKLLVTSLKPVYRPISEMICAIVAMLSVENVFYTVTNLDSTNPRDKIKLKQIKKRKRFMSQSSDHLCLLNVFQEFLKFGSGRPQVDFCNEYLINYKSIVKA